MSTKALCGGCMKEFTTKTIEKNGGMCFKCAHPKEETASSSEKAECPQCKKTYTARTINKNGGICGHCLKKNTDASEGAPIKPPRKSAQREKKPCSKCSKEFTIPTLEKYGGLCNRCHEKETAVPVKSSAFVGIPTLSTRVPSKSGLTIPGL